MAVGGGPIVHTVDITFIAGVFACYRQSEFENAQLRAELNRLQGDRESVQSAASHGN
jgi:hypothetical protein